jgi:hypothetical protein
LVAWNERGAGPCPAGRPLAGVALPPRPFSCRPRSNRSRPADEVEPTAGYYDEDTSSLRAGDAWRLGPGLWAPKRAGNGAQTDPGPEGILAKVRTGAPVNRCACSLNTHTALSRRSGPAASTKTGRAQGGERGPNVVNFTKRPVSFPPPRTRKGRGTLTGYRRAPGPERC